MDELERTLLYRLLSIRGAPFETEVHVGHLPATVQLTFPVQTRLLGSMEQKASPFTSHDGMNLVSYIRIELTSELNTRSWLAAFQSNLGSDWRPLQPSGLNSSGFLPADQGQAMRFYSAVREQTLDITSIGTPEGCELTLNLNGMRAEQLAQMESHFAQQARAPSLYAPEGVEVFPQGRGGGGGTWNLAATLVGSVTASDLLKHFGQQLEAQGWLLISTGEKDTLAFGQWRQEQQSLAFLSLAQQSGSVQATLVLTGLEPQSGSQVSVHVLS